MSDNIVGSGGGVNAMNTSTVSAHSTASVGGGEKKQTYKMQKQKYHNEKRRVAKELLSTFKDPTVVVMADWLKIRGTLRTWTKMYCVLKPGLLLIYKSPKTHKYGYWIGTVLLSTCELIERPSKRDGFCFKLFHPLDQSIWATRGPQGENFGAVTQPLPSSYLICRAPCEEAGRCWMDGLELALKCSSLLMRTMSKLQETASGSSLAPSVHFNATSGGGSGVVGSGGNHVSTGSTENNGGGGFSSSLDHPHFHSRLSQDDVSDTHSLLEHEQKAQPLSETEAERHFSEAGFDDAAASDSDEEDKADGADNSSEEETLYERSPPEIFGALGDSEQTEEVGEENKSLIWMLMKQVRPGMDLSKVVLPTFILEPRSFLEKLADYYYHADLLNYAVNEDDPFKRMKAVVKFYLSGFYKKPKGLKKPYNPILGEVFRCYWQHPDDDSRTFYIAEQVSHHPPISAIFVSNRKSGFNVSGSILCRSKFYGNSLSAILVGTAKVTLLSRGESYVVTLPYAHCKGLILGTLSMELGGTITIGCDRTSYTTEIDFKLKPFLSGSDSMNVVAGKIKLGKETLADLSGHWDSAIYITDRQTGDTEILWQPTQDVIARRLKRFEVPVNLQDLNESQRLWSKVTEAVKNNDQVAATEQKTVIEEAQRQKVRERKELNETHKPALFDFDPLTSGWTYKYADFRPWDCQNDLQQYERNFIIKTRVRHPTPLVRTSSLSTTDLNVPVPLVAAEVSSEDEPVNTVEIRKRQKHKTLQKPLLVAAHDLTDAKQLDDVIKPLQTGMQELQRNMQTAVFRLDQTVRSLNSNVDSLRTQMFIFLAVLVAFQAILALLNGNGRSRSSGGPMA